MSTTKELDFFVFEKNWSKGIEWYESNFVSTGEAKILGESSLNYTKYHVFRGVPSRMHSIVPGTELIYILRDPIDRIVSHYIHDYRKRKEHRKISEALTDLKSNHYVLCSKYYAQLEQYLDYFPRSTSRQAFRFLGVDDSLYSQDFSDILYRFSDKRRVNQIGVLLAKTLGTSAIKSSLPFPSFFAGVYRSPSGSRVKKPLLDEELKQALIGVLQDDIDRLRRYTGSDFRAWCL
jgi:hypothetical protein